MWRKCDPHIHGGPDDPSQPRLPADEIIAASVDPGLEVIATADHDEVMAVAEAVPKGEDAGVQVVPAVEISTERGHVLCYAPAADGNRGAEFTAGSLRRARWWHGALR